MDLAVQKLIWQICKALSLSLLKESHLLARPLMLYIRKLHSGKAQVQYTTMLVLCYKENIVFKYVLCSDSILDYVGIVQ